MKNKRVIAIFLCTILLVTALCGCGQTSGGGTQSAPAKEGNTAAEPGKIENTAAFVPTVIYDTDSYTLTADSMEIDEYGNYFFTFTFTNKSTDANWNCTFDSVYYNDIRSCEYASELNVAPGESVTLKTDTYGFCADVIGCNYIETVTIEAMIYDGWSNASADSRHEVFTLAVDNTSTQPAMGDFVQGGSMKPYVIFENEYARITFMDFDPEFSEMLYSTTPCLVLKYENLSDIPLSIDITEDFAVNGVPMGLCAGGATVLPHMTAYYFWDDTFADVKMSEFDIDEIETFEFTIDAEEDSTHGGLTDLIHEHVVIQVK